MAEPSDTPDSPPRLRIRLSYGDGQVMGPGKAELMEGIARTGSISAAGRAMGMSYKRAWQLVDTMNSMFSDPLVSSSRGGAKGGGAHLTEAGEEVLAAYRALEEASRTAGAPALARLAALRSDMSDGK